MTEGLPPELETRARQYVLRRALNEGWSRSDVWDIVRMLGFEETLPGGYPDPLGRNVPWDKRTAMHRSLPTDFTGESR